MLYLASQSPRRAELLTRLGLDFGRIDLDIPEQRQPGEAPADYVCRVAREKAGAGLLQMMSTPNAVVLGDEVFGNPKKETDAAAMLRRLSGHTHQVISAVSLISAAREAQALSISQVTFTELSDADIAAYVVSGEAMGKAGAYAIQGRAEQFVVRLDGSHSGVMGLPLFETVKLLKEFGALA
jgi:septum formation protein